MAPMPKKLSFDEFSQLPPEEMQTKLMEQIDSLPASVNEYKDSLRKNLSKAERSKNPSDDMKKAFLIIAIMENVLSEEQSPKFLQGAHIMLEDKGELYERLKEYGLVKDRISSHHKGNKDGSDASMQAGELFREFLIGKTADGKTWFQLEAHSVGGLKNFMAHMLDYVKYKFSGKNVGQYGLSEHVDSKPINIEPRGDSFAQVLGKKRAEEAIDGAQQKRG